MDTAHNIKQAVLKAFDELCALPVETLLAQRYQKYRNIGLTADSKASDAQPAANEASPPQPKRRRNSTKTRG